MRVDKRMTNTSLSQTIAFLELMKFEQTTHLGPTPIHLIPSYLKLITEHNVK